ncbi:TPA: hypothetical protein N0F65_006390 [Lagenidium giganteum]|uniref:4-coumarate--CoA ligase n=1 Tax=Lagenidium giganteum TaxID=4803 RepID=A0AAV2YRA8_9STRA|nr:TPA: hypothetical protein N0F65_006390 [Lagenidium giganteum]
MILPKMLTFQLALLHALLLERSASDPRQSRRHPSPSPSHSSSSSTMMMTTTTTSTTPVTRIYSSPYGSRVIPQDKTIWSAVEEQAVKRPSETAYVCGVTDQVRTFKMVHEHATAIAASLLAQGVVLLHSFNCIKYPIVFFALNRLGAVCTPSSPLFTPQELLDQIQTAKASAVITHSMLADAALAAAEMAGIPDDRCFTIGACKSKKTGKPLLSTQSMVERNLPLTLTTPVDPNAVVCVPFSSGTTGKPKGVEITGRALYANAIHIDEVENGMPCALGMLPFFHILAMCLFHIAMYKGCSVVVLPRFEPTMFLRAVSKYQIPRLMLAPPLMMFLAHSPEVAKYDLSATTSVISGGAPLGKELEQAVTKRLNVQIGQGYGMTELTGGVCYVEWDNLRGGSVGRLTPNTELRIKSLETDEDLPPNTPGELLFRTPQQMRGYLDNPEATMATITEDGFVRTGDVGYIDEDGFLFIVDRVKELIKYKGHQVAPAELEDVLNQHPQIADSCCVRGYDAKTGEEVPKAYVALRPGSAKAQTLTADAVVTYVAERVAPFKRVRQVEFIDAIPRSLAGKILRKQLQAREQFVHAPRSRL